MQAPGGRDNARVVSKATFAASSLPDEAGNFFLRPDRIMGMLLLNPGDPSEGYARCLEKLLREQNRDRETKVALEEHTRNADDVDRLVRRMSELKLTLHIIPLPNKSAYAHAPSPHLIFFLS